MSVVLLLGALTLDHVAGSYSTDLVPDELHTCDEFRQDVEVHHPVSLLQVDLGLSKRSQHMAVSSLNSTHLQLTSSNRSHLHQAENTSHLGQPAEHPGLAGNKSYSRVLLQHSTQDHRVSHEVILQHNAAEKDEEKRRREGQAPEVVESVYHSIQAVGRNTGFTYVLAELAMGISTCLLFIASCLCSCCPDEQGRRRWMQV
mmetsp:Transcript_982/g.988  ORF Transcript_982/g.988 Transcript_982/m.988 type:complete len:201 (+) Transcript_982:119-721(+)